MWDARPQFKARKLTRTGKYHVEKTYDLPRLDEDLDSGDLAFVFYSASSYPLDPSRHEELGATEGISFNLYGAVLIANKKD